MEMRPLCLLLQPRLLLLPWRQLGSQLQGPPRAQLAQALLLRGRQQGQAMHWGGSLQAAVLAPALVEVGMGHLWSLGARMRTTPACCAGGS